LESLISGRVGRNLLESGDVDNGLLTAGQVIGLVHDIPTVKELIDRTIKEAEDIMARLSMQGMFSRLRKPLESSPE
jgi:nitronate monooxygenase